MKKFHYPAQKSTCRPPETSYKYVFLQKIEQKFVYVFTNGSKCGIIYMRQKRSVRSHRYAQRGIKYMKGCVFLSQENYDSTFAQSAAERLCKIEERVKSNSHRISKFEELANAINSQNENIARLVAQLEAANEKLQSQDARLSAMEKRPGERVEVVVRSVLYAIAGALAGALAGYIF